MQPGDLKAPFDTLALLLPVLGLPLVLVIASLLRGSPRRLTLAIGPFLVGWAMMWVRPAIDIAPGDWITGLAVGVLFAFGYLAIGLYYIVLLVAATGSWLRRNAELRKAANPSAAEPG